MQYFYVEGKRYGPFPLQDDGFPNAGCVVRYFRNERNWSAPYTAERLGGVTTRWVLSMESNNKVPDSITRRRAMCALLGIPPALLGLAELSSLSAIENKSIGGKGIDLDTHRMMLPLLWQTLHIGTNQPEFIKQVQSIVNNLVSHQNIDSLPLLGQYYRLLARIYRENGQYQKAVAVIRKAEQIAKETGEARIEAAAVLTHGRILFEYGDLKSAITCFERSRRLSTSFGSDILGTSSIELAMALSRLPSTERDEKRILGLVGESEQVASRIKQDEGYTSLNAGILAVYRIDVALNLYGYGDIEGDIELAETKLPIEQIARKNLLEIYQSQYSLQRGEIYAAIASGSSAFEVAKKSHNYYQLSLLRDLARDMQARKQDKRIEAFVRLVDRNSP